MSGRFHLFRRPLPSCQKKMTGGGAMEFGLFHEFQDTSEAKALSQSFALVDAAEQWELDANFAP